MIDFLVGKKEVSYSLEDVEDLKKEGIKEFIPYLEQIKNKKVRKFTAICLENAPLYFWVIPAAVSEKRHPPFARGIGGVKKHTMVAHYYGDQLCDAYDLSPWGKDYILSAIDLHDTCKRGVEHYNMRYFSIHHMLPRMRYDKYQKRGHLDLREFNKIMKLIESHMGSIKEGHVIENKRPISDDMSLSQKIVYLADYTASRSRLESFKYYEQEL